MTKEEKIEAIRDEVEGLVDQAIKVLEKNYELYNADYDHPAYDVITRLSSAIIELVFLNDECLKIED